jgi:hypothetical protein
VARPACAATRTRLRVTLPCGGAARRAAAAARARRVTGAPRRRKGMRWRRRAAPAAAARQQSHGLMTSSHQKQQPNKPAHAHTPLARRPAHVPAGRRDGEGPVQCRGARARPVRETSAPARAPAPTRHAASTIAPPCRAPPMAQRPRPRSCPRPDRTPQLDGGGAGQRGGARSAARPRAFLRAVRGSVAIVIASCVRCLLTAVGCLTHCQALFITFRETMEAAVSARPPRAPATTTTHARCGDPTSAPDSASLWCVCADAASSAPRVPPQSWRCSCPS